MKKLFNIEQTELIIEEYKSQIDFNNGIFKTFTSQTGEKAIETTSFFFKRKTIEDCDKEYLYDYNIKEQFISNEYEDFSEELNDWNENIDNIVSKYSKYKNFQIPFNHSVFYQKDDFPYFVIVKYYAYDENWNEIEDIQYLKFKILFNN